MTSKKFADLLDYVIDEHIRGKLQTKSQEYSNDDDRLHNFKRAALIDEVSPEQALRGMDLKHLTSIRDFLDDLEQGVYYPKEVWLEKITDHCNYMLLLLALLYERYEWEVK